MANALPVRERAPSYFCKGAMPKITHEYAPKLWKPRIFHPRKWLKLGFKLPALPLWPGGFDLVSALLEMSRAGPRKQNRVELDGHLLSWKQFADNLRSRLSLITRHISIRGCACAFVGNSYSYWSIAAWRFSIEPTPAKRITREGRRFPLHDFKRCPQASTISENLRLFLGGNQYWFFRARKQVWTIRRGSKNFLNGVQDILLDLARQRQELLSEIFSQWLEYAINQCINYISAHFMVSQFRQLRSASRSESQRILARPYWNTYNLVSFFSWSQYFYIFVLGGYKWSSIGYPVRIQKVLGEGGLIDG